MAISFSDIEDAFFFVSMDQQYMHNAYLCKETGETFYTSEIGDSDELPEDLYTLNMHPCDERLSKPYSVLRVNRLM